MHVDQNKFDELISSVEGRFQADSMDIRDVSQRFSMVAQLMALCQNCLMFLSADLQRMSGEHGDKGVIELNKQVNEILERLSSDKKL